MRTYGFTLTDDQHAKLMALGGVRWLRLTIDAAIVDPGTVFVNIEQRDRAIALDIRPAKVVAAYYGISRSRVSTIREEAKKKGWPHAVFEKPSLKKKFANRNKLHRLSHAWRQDQN